MAKRNKTNNRPRHRYSGGEHVIVPKLSTLGVVRCMKRIDGMGAVLIVDLDNDLAVAVSPLEVILRGYQGC